MLPKVATVLDVATTGAGGSDESHLLQVSISSAPDAMMILSNMLLACIPALNESSRKHNGTFNFIHADSMLSLMARSWTALIPDAKSFAHIPSACVAALLNGVRRLFSHVVRYRISTMLSSRCASFLSQMSSAVLLSGALVAHSSLEQELCLALFDISSPTESEPVLQSYLKQLVPALYEIINSQSHMEQYGVSLKVINQALASEFLT